MLETAIATPQSAEDGWVELLPARTYHTDAYGDVPIAKSKLERMARNFSTNIRGQEIPVNFDHGMDRSKGNQAAGWFKEVAVKPSSSDPSTPALWGRIDFTADAKSEIKAGKWKYFSLEWDDNWTHTLTGETVHDVIVGGAVTNRPVAKHTKALPVNFSESMWSELDEDTRREFSVWSTATVNDLPDSSFLYIQPGGSKDSSGKTTPRTNRHFPYKTADGKVDMPHLRNAIARIPQSGSWLSDSMKSALQSRARQMLSAMTKNMSEEYQDAVALLLKEGLDVLDSSPDWGRQDPGTNSPLIGDAEQPDPGTTTFVPREQGDPASDDPAIGSGSRRDPLPLDPNDPNAPKSQQGGEIVVTEEELKKLFDDIHKLLKDSDRPAVTNAFSEVKFSEPESVIKQFAAIFTEYAALKADQFKDDEEKRFSEQFPRRWREMNEQADEMRVSRAKSFSEAVTVIKRQDGDKQVATKMGLSALALDTIANSHKKFAEGTGTVADFEAVVKAVVEGGVVNFSEDGSGRAGEPEPINTGNLEGLQAAKKQFSEKIDEIRASDEFKDKPFQAAFTEATKRYPELADAYSRTPAIATV